MTQHVPSTTTTLSDQLKRHTISFRIGDGRFSAWVCLLLGVLSLMGVLIFNYPEFLTTPELREAYNIPALRAGLGALMISCGGFGAFALLRGKLMPTIIGLAGLAIASIMGGADTTLGTIEASGFYIGLDWFVIGLLVVGSAFVLLERLAPVNEDQPTLRREWVLDMKYFFIMHLAMGGFLVASNAILTATVGWARFEAVTNFVSALPLPLQFILILLSIDLVEYTIHRLYHQGGFLWRVHAVHHSSEQMDWLASSRLHFVEALVTRTATLAPVFLLGFDPVIVGIYAAFVSFHATFLHANFRVDLSWIETIFVTPRHHHWHHANQVEAYNKNYAVHFSFIDRMFGTLYLPDGWPESYGVDEVDQPAHGFRAQLAHPFQKANEINLYGCRNYFNFPLA